MALVTAFALALVARTSLSATTQQALEPTTTATLTEATASATLMPTPTHPVVPTHTTTNPNPGATIPAEPTTTMQLVPFAPGFILQANGSTTNSAAAPNVGCTPGILVELRFSHSAPGTFTWHWQHYDANNNPAEPPAGSVLFSTDPTTDPYPAPTQSADKQWNTENGFRFTEYWQIQYSGGFNPITANWGDQLVITAINGESLRTPLASAIWHNPDPSTYTSC